MRNTGKDITIVINNLTVSYNDDGPENAPVIIFIHGFPLNKSMWNNQTEALKSSYRVIAYDVRGHGNSGMGNEDFAIELFVLDLIGLMDALKIDKAVLCGLSMGGYIALNAIATHPARIGALVLSDTNCIADSPETKEKRLKAIENIRELGVEEYAGESVINLFAPVSVATKPEEIATATEMIRNTSEESLYNTLLALAARKETCSILPDITVPVLIMVGEEDVITPPAAARLMQDKIKDCRLHIILNAGHLSNMENPSDFNNQLRKFVDSVYSWNTDDTDVTDKHR